MESKGWRIHILSSAVESGPSYAFPHSAPPRLSIRITLDEWRTLDEQSETFQPRINAPLSVWDSRLRTRNKGYFVEEVFYQVGRANLTWPTTNDSWLRAQFTGLSQVNQRPNARKSRILRLTLFTLIRGSFNRGPAAYRRTKQ